MDSGWRYSYKATVHRVIDGDTVDLWIDLGLGVFSLQRCRLYGINAPEMRGRERPLGQSAKDWLEAQILPQSIVVRTFKDKAGKYGRYLVQIFTPGADDFDESLQSVNERMIAAGHAVENFYK